MHPGMSSSSPWLSTNVGTNSLVSSLTDSLAQSRAHYQPGYMLSAAQSSVSPTRGSRADDVPIIPTKAKLNFASRGSASDFGTESMFDTSRVRKTLPDEDAPPTNSAFDIPQDIHVDSSSLRFSGIASDMKPSFLKRRSHASPPQSTQRLYVVVFGYPQDKYNATVEYFKSLGESTEPDQSLEVVNCFKIGFKDPTDAVRAVRRNGEVLGGSWMVGVKWADPATAEAAIGQSTLWASTPGPLTSQSPLDPRFSDSPTAHQSPEPTIGTPIRLAPSASAFRKPMSRSGIDMQTHGDLIDSGAQGTTQGKGVLGQVSNLLFGW